MNKPQTTYLTAEGKKKLQEELEELKTVKRPELAARLRHAIEQGDISENAEYDAAKDEQRDIEARIEQIEEILKNAEVIVESEASTKVVSVGCKVRVKDIDFDEELEYDIVGSTEANSLKNKISNESPVGKALMGAKKNQEVTVALPTGDIHYKVLKIMRNV